MSHDATEREEADDIGGGGDDDRRGLRRILAEALQRDWHQRAGKAGRNHRDVHDHHDHQLQPKRLAPDMYTYCGRDSNRKALHQAYAQLVEHYLGPNAQADFA